MDIEGGGKGLWMKGRDINSVGLRRDCARKTNFNGRERVEE